VRGAKFLARTAEIAAIPELDALVVELPRGSMSCADRCALAATGKTVATTNTSEANPFF